MMDGTDGMMDELAAFTGMPAISIPTPFSLSDPSLKNALDKLKGEIVDKGDQWENNMTTFFGEYEEYTDNWRVRATRPQGMPNRLFNSKSGETHRAVETLMSAELSQLISADPFFYADGEGLNEFGKEADEVELQAVEQVIRKQLYKIRWYEKMSRALRSKKLFGSMVVECPWITFPYGDGEKTFEGTDFILRSLICTGFNPFVFDMDQSDYIFTIDFPTIVMIRNWCSMNKQDWNKEAVEKVYQENKDGKAKSAHGVSGGNAYNRIIARKQRAGYNSFDNESWELLTYHGRVDTENDAIQKYWESSGRQDDPSFCDFSIGVMEEEGVIRFNPTPFKTWHHLFKTAHEKLFELEPLAYGVGKIGRKRQRENDALESRMNDLIMFNVLPMWKIGKYAGVDVSKLTIKPWNFVELENIDQLEPIKANIEALPYAANVQGLFKEDFRAMTGATGNLQGTASADSATESAIIQNESMRYVQIQAKIMAEVFLKDYLETCHVNNIYLMDNGFWVKTMNVERPFYVNKDNLPVNVGFTLKTTQDKDGRPQTIQNILQALQMATSFRNSPTAMNVIEPLWQQLFRALGMDTRLLTKPLPLYQQMTMNMQMMQNQKGQNGQMTENESMREGAMAGGGTPEGGMMQTPVGAVETSPNPMSVSMS